MRAKAPMLVAGHRLRRVAASRQQGDRTGEPQITQITQIFREHGSEAALQEHDCERLLEEYLPKITELLESIQFLRRYPLIYIQGMQFSEGAFQYSYQICKGAFRSFHSETFTHAQPFETQRLYILDPSNNSVLALYPWLGLYRCEACGDRDIFLTARWSATKLNCIEFSRGHRYSPKDVSGSLAKMVETLESRIRGTPYDYKAGT